MDLIAFQLSMKTASFKVNSTSYMQVHGDTMFTQAVVASVVRLSLWPPVVLKEIPAFIKTSIIL